MIWNVRNRRLECGKHTLCMGILNVTPDSFSDGGRYSDPEAAVEEGRRMFASGADLVDVGGESTRPGSEPVTEAEELNRVIPVIAALSRLPGALVSVDTTKARVATESIAAGAQVINDISALRGDPGMAKVAAETGAGVVLMHMLGTPRSMQDNPVYADVVTEVRDFLRERVEAAVSFHCSRIGLPRGPLTTQTLSIGAVTATESLAACPFQISFIFPISMRWRSSSPCGALPNVALTWRKGTAVESVACAARLSFVKTMPTDSPFSGWLRATRAPNATIPIISEPPAGAMSSRPAMSARPNR